MKKRLTDLLFRDIMKDKNIELKLGIIAILMLLAGIFATQCNGQQNITKRSVTLDSLISRQHDTIWITNGIGGKGWLRIADDTLFFSNIKANTLTFNEAFVDTSFFDEIIVRDTALIDFIIEHGGGALLVGNGLYIENDTIKLGGGTKIKDNTVIGVQHNSVDYYDNEYQKGIYIHVSKYPAGSALSVSSLQVKADYNPTLSPYERLDSSTYIKFTGFHCPTGSYGLYAESRFNELGFSYKDTLSGRNKNNPRWIPDKAYVDGLCSSGGSAVGDVGDVQFSDGASGFTNSEGISSGSVFNWDGTVFEVDPDGYSSLRYNFSTSTPIFEMVVNNAGTPVMELQSTNETYYWYGYFDGALGGIFLRNGGSTTANSEFSVALSDEKLLEVTYDKGGIKVKQLSGSLTDGTPTAAEITAIVGVSASVAGAGFQVTIKDSDGTGLLYKVESDGTDWYYQVLTKALTNAL